jgi:hypothetical protein
MDPTFSLFPQLSKELRLRIWSLARVPHTVEQVWNNSKTQWEFIRDVPAILHVCSESRTEFIRKVDDPNYNALVYRLFEDVRPFYFCFNLDTIYIRRQCMITSLLRVWAKVFIVNDFDLSIMRQHLRALQMVWGLRPYWWTGSRDGPALLRSFPRLEAFTLIVVIMKRPQQDPGKDMTRMELSKCWMELAKSSVREQLGYEHNLHPEWHIPEVRYQFGGGSVD